MRGLAVVAVVLACAASGTAAAQPALVEGTVVTMDDTHTIVPDGRVLVRD